MRRLLNLLVLACACLPFEVQAYELGTHARLTQQVHLRSVLTSDETLLSDLGIADLDSKEPFGTIYFDVSGDRIEPRSASAFAESENRMPNDADPLSIQGWLMRGAIREDDAPGEGNPQDDPFPTGDIFLDSRPLKHFYDPFHDRVLNVGGVPVPGAEKAPDWAIGSTDAFKEPNTPELFRRNHFTVFDAREAMYRALTGNDRNNEAIATTADERNKYWATTFRSLGDVVHLIQDMAQPQHTRNDPHAGRTPEFLTGHGSVYEEYIEARATGELAIDRHDANCT